MIESDWGLYMKTKNKSCHFFCSVAHYLCCKDCFIFSLF